MPPFSRFDGATLFATAIGQVSTLTGASVSFDSVDGPANGAAGDNDADGFWPSSPACTPPPPSATPAKSSMRTGPKPRKSISFRDDHSVAFIPNLASYSKAERESMWLSRKEVRKIKDDCLYTLEVMEYGLSYLLMGRCSEEVCLRGLELHTTQGLKTRQRNKKTCRALVLGEDADSDNSDDDASCATRSVPRPRKRGAVVTEVRSRQYSDASLRSAIEAHVMGLKDAAEAAKQ